VVILVFDILMSWAMKVINPVVTAIGLANYTARNELLAQGLAGIGVLLFIAVLGFIYSSTWTLRWRKGLGKFINFIPLFGTIYLSVRQVASSLTDTESRFKKLVMVEYPRENLYNIGLMTSKAPGPIQEEGESTRYTVFLPNSPNPTGGWTIVVPEEEIIDVDMSVQKGLKLLMTTGMAFEDEELPEELVNIEEEENKGQ
jgi:uncharacterized membrane protein